MFKFLTFKTVLIPIGVALVVAALGASHYQAYQMGQDNVNLELMKELEKSRNEQARLTDELEAERAKRRAGTRVEVRYVDRAPDPSGCLDAPVLDDRMFDTLGGRDG